MKMIKQILQSAKNILIKYGWIKGKAYDHSTGSYCLAGAVWNSLDGAPYKEAMALHHEALNTLKSAGEISTEISAWNDEPDRSVDEVFALLDKAMEECVNEN